MGVHWLAPYFSRAFCVLLSLLSIHSLGSANKWPVPAPLPQTPGQTIFGTHGTPFALTTVPRLSQSQWYPPHITDEKTESWRVVAFPFDPSLDKKFVQLPL